MLVDDFMKSNETAVAWRCADVKDVWAAIAVGVTYHDKYIS